MKENKYDDEKFFNQYSQMPRSVNGLKGAGEWHILKTMLPDFKGKRVWLLRIMTSLPNLMMLLSVH